MTKFLRKYCLEFISLLLLYTFIFINVSLCEILISDCVQMKSEICCENAGESDCGMAATPESCCCIIKEATDQKSEVPVNITNSQQKNLFYSYYIEYTPGKDFSNKSLEICTFVFHPPPGSPEIYLINSNLRI